jgi:hypothetical protein
MEWYSVYYNGLQTNVEVTKCGLVRRIYVDWLKFNRSVGIIDFSKLKLDKNYLKLKIQVNTLKGKTVRVQQLVGAAFLNYNFDGHNTVVDHIDNNTLNNNLKNLQVITNRENCSRLQTYKSGLPVGVTLDKRRNKYYARIEINKKRIHLGYFNTPEEASQAYQNKLKDISLIK